ncbi:MAG TPA: CHASE3 domain-containing protein [Leptolyngbyaceae cyanobacterium M33_DOE_097]|uniref:Chemotaxis protein n=1 Tax=Oscillatoriales cyanobacterium SpSt-418 TaxID=2282169 RepID=A0A7C3KF55_9CYAN|nr:CHASE3 domain-containing protein [Leptolyngbyaceae cyanobacterium M33_DOE_097]
MESKRGWRLRYWIIGGYMIPLTALVLSAIATIFNINTVNQRSSDLYRSEQVDSVVNDLAVSVQSSDKAFEGYLLSKTQKTLSSYQESQNRSKQLLAQLMTIVQNEGDRQIAVKVESILNDLRRLQSDVIELVEQNKLDQAIKTWSRQENRQKADDITALVEEMQSREAEAVSTAIRQQQDALNNLRLVVLMVTSASLLLSILIGFWVISRTAQRMNASASAIAASTTEIVATIEQQERSAMQQATSVNQTTTTMDELGASSRQSAEQAEASATGAQQVLLLVDGRTQDGQTSRASLREKVGEIATQILRLSEHTNQIGSISTLVSDLANQTNMLALNAAVEAVRAGEHGKGFSVVAAEIRKLADQSKKSAEKINALVVEIQNSTNSTVMVTDEGTKTVDKIVDAVKTITLNGQQIALTSNQQAIAVQQVVGAMNSLNLAARETAAGISQIKVGTKRLNDAAQELKTIV